MNATDKIIESLKNVFAVHDEQILESSKVWAAGRKQALTEYKMSEEGRALYKKDTWGYYDKLFAICGGKTWYKVFNGNGNAAFKAFMVKNHEESIEKRNAKIAAKLEKEGVTEVLSEDYVRTNDGFNGTFVVNTDSGKKLVTVETIISGGYNVQCLHMRVLCKVK